MRLPSDPTITGNVMCDLVFINWRTGEPAKNGSYDTHLYKLCDEAGIKRFVCTPFGIHTPPGPLRVGCSLKCYSSCSVTPALRLLWTAMFMSPTIHCELLFGSLNRLAPKLDDKME